jgi:hypothetical protein
MKNISQPCLNAWIVCMEEHIPSTIVLPVARPEARGWRVWRAAVYALEPLQAVHLAAVLAVLLPLRRQDPADRARGARRAPAERPGRRPHGGPRPGQEAGPGLQLQAWPQR